MELVDQGRAVFDQPLNLESPELPVLETTENQTGTTLCAHFTIDQPKLWTPDQPHLYSLVLTLKNAAGEVMESVCQRIGLREIEVSDRRRRPADASQREALDAQRRQPP